MPALWGAQRLHHDGGVVARPLGQIFGIEGDVAVIVDVRLELVVAPVVERVGEQEAASRAAAVIDGHAGERRAHAADLAGAVHVDDAEQRGVRRRRSCRRSASGKQA